jgi:hypothetical protein
MRAISRADLPRRLLEQRRQRVDTLDCGLLGFTSVVPESAELLSPWPSPPPMLVFLRRQVLDAGPRRLELPAQLGVLLALDRGQLWV